MKSDKSDNIISLVGYKESMLCKAIACFLSLCFLITNLAYGYDKSDIDHLRQVRESNVKKVHAQFDASSDGFADIPPPRTSTVSDPARSKFDQSLDAIRKLDKPTRVSFVMPMYREEDRLMPKTHDNPSGEDALRKKVHELEGLREANPNFEWQIIAVDDGSPLASSDKCVEVLTKEISGELGIDLSSRIAVEIITPEEKAKLKSRKGGAVLRGFKRALDDDWADYIGITDTDVSTSLTQTGLLLDPLTKGKSEVAIGSRWKKGAVTQKIPLSGIVSGKIYNWCIRIILFPLRRIQDTQRGFKLFKKDVAKQILPHARDNGFSFDTELLLLSKLAGYEISEHAIVWIDSPDATKLSMLRDAPRMFWGILKQTRHIIFNPFRSENARKFNRVMLLTTAAFAAGFAVNYLSGFVMDTSLYEVYFAYYQSGFVNKMIAGGLASSIIGAAAELASLYLSDNPSQRWKLPQRFISYTVLKFGIGVIIALLFVSIDHLVPGMPVARTVLSFTIGMAVGSTINLFFQRYFALDWAKHQPEEKAAKTREEYTIRKQTGKTLYAIETRTPANIIMHDFLQNFFSPPARIVVNFVWSYFVSLFKNYISNVRNKPDWDPKKIVYVSVGVSVFSFIWGTPLLGVMAIISTIPIYLHLKRSFVQQDDESTVKPQDPPLGPDASDRPDTAQGHARTATVADKDLPYIEGAIDNLRDVPRLPEARNIVKNGYPDLWARTHGIFNTKGVGGMNYMWASNMQVPIMLYLVDGKYALLVDSEYRGNGRLLNGLKENGWNRIFTLHQALFLDIALRQLVLEESTSPNGGLSLASATASFMTGRAWIDEHGPKNARMEFLGTKKEPGLAYLLNDTCADGHPSRFTDFYKSLFMGRKKRSSISDAMVTLNRVKKDVRRFLPAAEGECRLKDVMPQFFEMNPIYGRALAKEVCDYTARKFPEYCEGELYGPFPDVRLSYTEELALVRVLEEDPDNEDAKNAFVYCMAQSVGGCLDKVVKKGVHKKVHIEHEDVRQVILLELVGAINDYRIETGVQFSTYFISRIDPVMIAGNILRGEEQLTRLGEGKLIPIKTDEDEEGGVDIRLMEDDTEPDPLAELFKLDTDDDIQRALSVIPAKERLYLKLLTGVRFETDPGPTWTYDQIGTLHNPHISGQAVQQAVAKACERIRELKRKNALPTVVRRLTDSDVYIATYIVFPCDHELFATFAEEPLSVTKEIAGAILGIFAWSRRERETAIDDIDHVKWALFHKEFVSTREPQRNFLKKLKKPRKKRELSEREKARRYDKFKALVTDYVAGDYANEKEKARLIDMIVDMGTVRAPVSVENVNKKQKNGKTKKITRRVVYLSGQKGSRKMWIAVSAAFDDVVYVTPREYNGKLNIEIRNIAKSQYEVLPYNSYWDSNKRRSVAVARELDNFLNDPTDSLPVPERKLQKRATIVTFSKERDRKQQAYLEVISRKKIPIYSECAYFEFKDTRIEDKRLFWISAFRDEFGKGVTIHLSPDGPPMGKAYYVNGEFIAEPGHLLKRKEGGLLNPESGRNLVARLLDSAYNENSAFTVTRRTKKRTLKQKNGDITRYDVSPFGSVDGKIGVVKVGYAPDPMEQYHYVKFFPWDRRLGIYTRDYCSYPTMVEQKFYDLTTLKTHDAPEELKRRYKSFRGYELPNAIFVNSDSHGHIYFSDDFRVPLGYKKTGIPYFIVFFRSGPNEGLCIRLYETEGEGFGRIASLSREIRFPEEDAEPVIKVIEETLEAIARVQVHEKADRLGYHVVSVPLTPEEKKGVLDRFKNEVRLEENVADEVSEALAAEHYGRKFIEEAVTALSRLRFAEAISLAERAIIERPHDNICYNILAQACFKDGRYNYGISTLSDNGLTLKERFVGDHRSHCIFANLLERLGMVDDAIAVLSDDEGKTPKDYLADDPVLWRNLARLLDRADRLDDAIEVLTGGEERSLRENLREDISSWCSLATIYEHAGRIDDAIAVLTEGDSYELKEDLEDYAVPYALLARLLAAKKEHTVAEKLIHRMLSYFTGNPKTHMAAITSYIRMGEFLKAREVADSATSAFPDMPIFVDIREELPLGTAVSSGPKKQPRAKTADETPLANKEIEELSKPKPARGKKAKKKKAAVEPAPSKKKARGRSNAELLADGSKTAMQKLAARARKGNKEAIGLLEGAGARTSTTNIATETEAVDHEERVITGPVSELREVLADYKEQNILTLHGDKLLDDLRAETDLSVDNLGFDIEKIRGMTVPQAIENIIMGKAFGGLREKNVNYFITPEEYVERNPWCDWGDAINKRMLVMKGCGNACNMCLVLDLRKLRFVPYPIIFQAVVREQEFDVSSGSQTYKIKPSFGLDPKYRVVLYNGTQDNMHYLDKVCGADLSHLIKLIHRFPSGRPKKDYILSAGHSPFNEDIKYVARTFKRMAKIKTDKDICKAIFTFTLFNMDIERALLSQKRELLDKAVEAYKAMYRELFSSWKNTENSEIVVRGLDLKELWDDEFPLALKVIHKLQVKAICELVEEMGPAVTPLLDYPDVDLDRIRYPRPCYPGTIDWWRSPRSKATVERIKGEEETSAELVKHLESLDSELGDSIDFDSPFARWIPIMTPDNTGPRNGRTSTASTPPAARSATVSEFEDILKKNMHPTKTPTMIKKGRFNIVSTPWRKGKRMPARPFTTVTLPFDDNKFHFCEQESDVTGLGFDESEIFWEGVLEGVDLSLIEQKWPYAMSHFLVAPQRKEKRPQIIEQKDLELAIKLVRQQPVERFRMSCNSLKAGASVNHMHFHAFAVPEGLSAVERAKPAVLYNVNGVSVNRIAVYPANTLMFRSDNAEKLAETAYEYIRQLQILDIAHTSYITPHEIYIFPVNSNFVTSFGNTWTYYELIGYILKIEEDQDISSITEEDIAAEMKAVTIDDEEFISTYKSVFEGHDIRGVSRFYPYQRRFVPEERYVTTMDDSGAVTLATEFKSLLGTVDAETIETKTFEDFPVVAVLNTARAERVSAWKTIQEKADCPLCGAMEEEKGYLLGVGRGFVVIPEKFAYFDQTATVVQMNHQEPRIDAGLIESMLQMLYELGPFGFRVAYNHRRAGQKILHQSYRVFREKMPIEDTPTRPFVKFNEIEISTIDDFPMQAFLIETKRLDLLAAELQRMEELLELLQIPFNLFFARRSDGLIRTFVILRGKRSDRSKEFGDKVFGIVESCGVALFETKEDFERPTLKNDLESAYVGMTLNAHDMSRLCYVYKAHAALSQVARARGFEYEVDTTGSCFYVFCIPALGEVLKYFKLPAGFPNSRSYQWNDFFMTGYDVARRYLGGLFTPMEGVSIDGEGRFVSVDPENPPDYLIQKIVPGENLEEQVKSLLEGPDPDVKAIVRLYEEVIGFYVKMIAAGVFDIDIEKWRINFKTGAEAMGYDTSHIRDIFERNIFGERGYAEDFEDAFDDHISDLMHSHPKVGRALKDRFGSLAWTRELGRQGLKIPKSSEERQSQPMVPWTSQLVGLSNKALVDESHPPARSATVDNTGSKDDLIDEITEIFIRRGGMHEDKSYITFQANLRFRLKNIPLYAKEVGENSIRLFATTNAGWDRSGKLLCTLVLPLNREAVAGVLRETVKMAIEIQRDGLAAAPPPARSATVDNEWVDIDIGGGKTIKINNAGKIFTKANYYIDLFARNMPEIVSELRKRGNKLERACELFSGRGILAIGLAKQVPEIKEVIAVDIHEEPVERIAENAQTNGVGDKVKALQSDAFEFLENDTKGFDLIVCDSPFIPRDMSRFSDEQLEELSKKFPDLISIFKGNTPDGRYYIDRLILEFAREKLRPGGALIFTQGDFTNIEKSAYLMRQEGLEPLSIDSAQQPYVIASEEKLLSSTGLTSMLKDYIESLETGIEELGPYRFAANEEGELVFHALIAGGVKPAARTATVDGKPSARTATTVRYPSMNDMHNFARKNKAFVVDVANEQAVKPLLKMLRKADIRDGVDIISRARRGDTNGLTFLPEHIQAISAKTKMTPEEIKAEIGMPDWAESLVVITDKYSFLHELAHIVQNPRSDSRWVENALYKKYQDIIADFVVLMFTPAGMQHNLTLHNLDLMKSAGIYGNLLQRYRDRSGRDPNLHISQMLADLKNDILSEEDIIEEINRYPRMGMSFFTLDNSEPLLSCLDISIDKFREYGMLFEGLSHPPTKASGNEPPARSATVDAAPAGVNLEFRVVTEDKDHYLPPEAGRDARAHNILFLGEKISAELEENVYSECNRREYNIISYQVNNIMENLLPGAIHNALDAVFRQIDEGVIDKESAALNFAFYIDDGSEAADESYVPVRFELSDNGEGVEYGLMQGWVLKFFRSTKSVFSPYVGHNGNAMKRILGWAGSLKMNFVLDSKRKDCPANKFIQHADGEREVVESDRKECGTTLILYGKLRKYEVQNAVPGSDAHFAADAPETIKIGIVPKQVQGILVKSATELLKTREDFADLIKGSKYDLRVSREWKDNYPKQYEILTNWWEALEKVFGGIAEFNTTVLLNGSADFVDITCTQPGGKKQSSAVRLTGSRDIGPRLLRVLNTAFIASNVPDITGNEGIGSHEGMLKFINDQIFALTGIENYINLDSYNPDTIANRVRIIELNLQPIERVDFDRQMELNMAIEALRAV